MITTINRYIFRELIPPFLISSIFLTSIFLMTRIPEITNMVMNYNTGILSVLLLISYTIPRFMEFTIPMSVMISILLTFMRMSGDNEIIALKGGGVTIYRLLPPVLIFCVLGTALTMWVTIYGVPLGRLAFKITGMEIAQSNLNVALSDRKFNATFKDVMIYVSAMDIKTKKLKDIFIEDRRTEGRVIISVAPEGILAKDSTTGSYTLRLYGGTVNQVDLKNRVVNLLGFDTYDINLDFGNKRLNVDKELKDIDEMGVRELLSVIKNSSDNEKALNSGKMAFHEKFSVPFACLALGFLAIPLGLQSAFSRRSQGFGLAMFFFIVYYLLLALGWSAGETGWYPPVLGMWLPDLIMGGIGIYLLVRIAKEKPVTFPRVFASLYQLFKTRLMIRGMK